jgi:hypothetical protein
MRAEFRFPEKRDTESLAAFFAESSNFDDQIKRNHHPRDDKEVNLKRRIHRCNKSNKKSAGQNPVIFKVFLFEFIIIPEFKEIVPQNSQKDPCSQKYEEQRIGDIVHVFLIYVEELTSGWWLRGRVRGALDGLPCPPCSCHYTAACAAENHTEKKRFPLRR